MKLVKFSVVALAVLTLATSSHATLKSEKVTLKGNMSLKYTKLPTAVDSVSDIFSKGMFYGRLR